MFCFPQGQVPSCMAQPDTRIAYMAAAELDGNYAQTTAVPALATFQLRARDTMDFSIDFSNWLIANGNSSTVLTSAVWAVATGSPSTPVLGSSVFNPQGRCTVIVSAPAGALAGSAYWLDLTVGIGPTTVQDGTDVAIPARTMTRRIYIVVVNG